MVSRRHYQLLGGLTISLSVVLNLVGQSRKNLSVRDFSFSYEALWRLNATSLFQKETVEDIRVVDFLTTDGENESLMSTMRLKRDPNALRDIHVVMIGDTLMRYQYLSLAYRLRHGIWFQDSAMGKFDLFDEYSFDNPFNKRTKAEFLLQSNNVLHPLEVCDCFANSGIKNATLENRYFYDPEHNNSVVYLAAFGHEQALEGRFLPHHIQNSTQFISRRDIFRKRQPSLWQYTDWADVMLLYVRYLEPQPRHIIMSIGLSEHRFGRSKDPSSDARQWSQETQRILQAMANISEFRFTWQTASVDGQRARPDDEEMCSIFPICLNVSYIKPALDGRHREGWYFKEPVYRFANEKLLDVLGYLPDGYQRIEIQASAKSDKLQNQTVVPESNESPTAKLLASDPSTLLRDLRIVMIGDSLMRYQYLSLVYRLRFGVWFDSTRWHFNLVGQSSFTSLYHGRQWGEFLLQTNKLLLPYELCDCYRRPHDIVENRYYFDPILNNSVVYMSAFGHHTNAMRGRVPYGQVHQERANRSSVFKNTGYLVKGDIVWTYADWGDTILNYIRYLDPPPRHVVMNAGIWPHNFCVANETHAYERTNSSEISATPGNNEINLSTNDTHNLLHAMSLVPELQFVWRTTTFGKNGLRPNFECDDVMCHLLPTCVNVSFTRHLQPEIYWDQNHVQEPGYRAVNEIMLDKLGYLPEGYLPLKLTAILN